MVLNIEKARVHLNKIKKKYENKHQSKLNDTYNEEQLQQINLSNSQLKYEQNKIKQKTQIQMLSQIKRIQQTFCDKIILKNLQKTLKQYEQDLNILYENKQRIQNQIDILVNKIKKIPQIQQNNKILSEQNNKSQQFLKSIIHQYHQSMKILMKQKINQQQLLNNYRTKVKLILKQIKQDTTYINYVNQWNNHIQKIKNDKLKINQIIKQNKQKNQTQEIIKIIPNKQSIKRTQDVFDQIKPKKKISQSQKALISQNFKKFAAGLNSKFQTSS